MLDSEEKSTEKKAVDLSGLYTISKASQSKTAGNLIDSNGFEYKHNNVFKTIASNPFLYYYVPRI
jgi:hypothetical protein